jgi:pyruvate dehydrogenase E2 component (dihydrolipoamide acetyltransferase)
MPALSPTMTEGVIAKWLKHEGETISPGEVIAEIETDKAIIEYEAVDEGILSKILIPEGTTVQVNTVIAILTDRDTSISVDVNRHNPVEEQSNPTENSISDNQTNTPVHINNNQTNTTINIDDHQTNKVFISPVAKKIANDHNININDIKGSGPYGRIIKDDINNILNTQQHLQTFESKKELSNMRKVIAKRLVESKTTIPHFYLHIDIDVTELVKLRQEINKNTKISLNDFIVKAVALAIQDNPKINTSWSDDAIIQNTSIDICVAVALDDGLITPLVKDADKKTLSSLSNEIKSLVMRAKANELKPFEFQGGSFTISNLGMYGIDHFTAIINPPQSAILAVGAVIAKPMVIDHTIVIRDSMSLTLSCDHRLIDGALAAMFLNDIKKYLMNPLLIMI